jgi:hypothetical protein
MITEAINLFTVQSRITTTTSICFIPFFAACDSLISLILLGEALPDSLDRLHYDSPSMSSRLPMLEGAGEVV